MSNANSNTPTTVKPFGNTEDPRGFYQLLLAHVTWLSVHNFSKTTVEKRGLYVKAFALWCIECDLTSPHVITKPILEAFQRHLFSYRKPDGKPLAWSSQHLHLKEVKQFFSWLAKQNYIPFSPATEIELPKQPKTLPSRSYLPMKSNASSSSPTSPRRLAFAIEPSSKSFTPLAFDVPRSVHCTSTTSTSIAKSLYSSRQRPTRSLRSHRPASSTLDRPLRRTSS